MTVRIAVVALGLLWTIGVWQSGLRAQDPQPTRSTWDGVYTEEQSKRGEPLYQEHCGLCHGEDLEGDGMAPALTGSAFLSNWDSLTLGDLFERIRISMPPAEPNSVGRPAKVDIVAFLLSANQFPAGTTALANETPNLKQIRFDAKKPSGK
jgi:hypothetical protein